MWKVCLSVLCSAWSKDGFNLGDKRACEIWREISGKRCKTSCVTMATVNLAKL
jgi:hypothetical protein